jgi:hypothetical protein
VPGPWECFPGRSSLGAERQLCSEAFQNGNVTTRLPCNCGIGITDFQNCCPATGKVRSIPTGTDTELYGGCFHDPKLFDVSRLLLLSRHVAFGGHVQVMICLQSPRRKQSVEGAAGKEAGLNRWRSPRC